jgi:hypothetical protein
MIEIVMNEVLIKSILFQSFPLVYVLICMISMYLSVKIIV